MDYYRVEPWGFPARDLRHGALVSAVLAPHFRRGTSPDPRDYMLSPPPASEVSEAEAEGAFDLLFGVAAAPAPVRAPEEG